MTTWYLATMLATVLATAACVFGLGWQARGCLADRQECARQDADRAARAAPCDRPVPYRLSVAGLLEVPADWEAGPPFAGTSGPGLPGGRLGKLLRADRLALLSDAMAITERQHGTAEVAREVDAIFAEVEADPDRWRYRLAAMWPWRTGSWPGPAGTGSRSGSSTGTGGSS